MPWTAGDCYWAQGVNEPRPHLRVVVTKPDLSERFIVVNMTSMRAGADQTTVLKPGDHQLVRHESICALRGFENDDCDSTRKRDTTGAFCASCAVLFRADTKKDPSWHSQLRIYSAKDSKRIQSREGSVSDLSCEH
jgi:hypothetical protein